MLSHGDSVFLGTRSGIIGEWSCSHNRCVRQIHPPDTGWTSNKTLAVMCMAITRHGDRLYWGSVSNVVQCDLIDDHSRLKSKLFNHHRYVDGINTLCLTPDDTYLFYTHHERMIDQWSTQDGTLVRRLDGHTMSVETTTMHPSGAWLFSGSYDKTVRQWCVVTGNCVRVFQCCYFVSYLQVRDRQLYSGVFTGQSQDLIQEWDIMHGTCVRHTPYPAPLKKFMFHPVHDTSIIGVMNRHVYPTIQPNQNEPVVVYDMIVGPNSTLFCRTTSSHVMVLCLNCWQKIWHVHFVSQTQYDVEEYVYHGLHCTNPPNKAQLY